MNISFTRKQFVLIGTLLFHLLLLLFMNFSGIRPIPSQEPGIRVVFEDPEELDIQEKEADPEEEELEKDISDPTNERKNIAVNENEEREKSATEFSRHRLEKIDEQVEKELEELQKEVIAKRREEGKGFVEEEFTEKEEVQEPEEKIRSDKAFKGTTNISYNLEDRYAVTDYNPVYLCQEGGKVVVNIKVNRSGKVVNAKVNEQASVKNYCLFESAEEAAYKFQFDENSAAPFQQEGTITIHFASQ